ncbi:MAG: histidinol-phosphate transaminase [Bacteriovoracia bacterium]
MALEAPEYIRNLSPYVPGKPIEETQREFGIKRVVKLASNENPWGPSPRAMKAVKESLRDLHRYPDASAYHLKKALSAHLKVPTESLLIGNGSNEVIDMVIRTYCVPGTAIVTSKAAFVAYRICAQIHGVATLEVPYTEDLRFDLPGILKIAEEYENARVVFIANPNNPTGTYVNGDELRDFLRKVSRVRGGSVLTVLDYAYWEYVTASDLPDALPLLQEFPNLVILRTFSKIYGLAGLRVGYGVSSAEIVADLEKIRQPFNCNAPGLLAAEHALKDVAFVRSSVKSNQVGMRLWEKSLDEMGIPYWPSQGNFLLADVGKGLGKRGGDVYLACLRKGVIFRPVANYGLMNALRITVGTPDENRVAIEALRDEMPGGRVARKAKANGRTSSGGVRRTKRGKG